MFFRNCYMGYKYCINVVFLNLTGPNPEGEGTMVFFGSFVASFLKYGLSTGLSANLKKSEVNRRPAGVTVLTQGSILVNEDDGNTL
jgi:hypothetical protein